MPMMDINEYYRHAMLWKHQKEATERLQAQEVTAAIQARWKEIASMLREALPIEGMLIMETWPGQFQGCPDPVRLIDLDCLIDPVLQDEVARGQGSLLPGVIRARVYWDHTQGEEGWKILKYLVLVDGISTEFEIAYEAFLQVYAILQEGAPR